MCAAAPPRNVTLRPLLACSLSKKRRPPAIGTARPAQLLTAPLTSTNNAGGGHNALVAALLLRRQGLQVRSGDGEEFSLSLCVSVFGGKLAAASFSRYATPPQRQAHERSRPNPKTQVQVFEEKPIVGGACRTEYPFPKVPGLGHSTGAFRVVALGWLVGGWVRAVVCTFPSHHPSTLPPPHPRIPPGAYLLGVMPPELMSTLGLKVETIRRDPHYFLPTTGDKCVAQGGGWRADCFGGRGAGGLGEGDWIGEAAAKGATLDTGPCTHAAAPCPHQVPAVWV
jgi:hypothetical protein